MGPNPMGGPMMGGGGAAGPAAAIPPQIAAMLAGGAGAGAAVAPPAAVAGGGELHPIQILKQMIMLGQQYMQVEPDEEDKATMAKLLSTLQQYLAKDQQDQQQAMGGNPSIARILRKPLPPAA